MKKFLLSSLLVVGALSSCQQVDSVDQADGVLFDFKGITTDVLTRSVSAMDVVSLCSDFDQSFTTFSLFNEKGSWSNYGVNEVNFYAHYPQLDSAIQLESERDIVGGDDLLFATTEASYGVSTVVLDFKRVVVPVTIKYVNEDGSYSTPSSAKTIAANTGKQNLKTGAIKANETAKSSIEIGRAHV